MKLFSFLKSFLNPHKMGPSKIHLNNAKSTLRHLKQVKQWYCGGIRSAGIAAQLLNEGKIIALPTDTIYGLAGLAQNDESIARLYEIKKRETNKPLAICLWCIEDIPNWADVTHLPEGLTEALLPGPTTLILKRKDTLNPLLNPGVENVGIRVPNFNFTRSVVRMVNQPIALTSANISNQQSTLHPEEFKDLWPELDGIFYEKMTRDNLNNSWRKGSTIIDLSVEGEFEVIRKGIGFNKTIRTLKHFKLISRAKKKKMDEFEKQSIDTETSEKMEASVSN